ncbi:MAG: response regulator [Phycisphaera sp.]|nr:response regulator [Phycisphaera sp.]
MATRPIVYIVETGVETTKLLKTMTLLRQEVELAHFDTPEAFQQAYDPDRPGCLILDMHVEGYDGHDVIRQLNERMFSLPTIVLINAGDVITARDVLRAGATEFLEKPVQIHYLIERVHDSLKASTASIMREGEKSAAEAEKVGPIGTLMIDQGTLTVEQVEAILAYQAHHNDKAFGELAMEMFAVDPLDIWRARAVQLLPLLKVVNLSELTPSTEALGAIDAGEAATYWVLPLSVEGDHLVIATTANRLGEAMMKCHSIFRHTPIKFVLAAPVKLRGAIEKCYGQPPVTYSDTGPLGDLQPERRARKATPEEPAPDDVQVQCSRCDEKFYVEPDMIGKRVGCPACGEPVPARRAEDLPEPLTLPGSERPDADPELSLEVVHFGDVNSGDLSITFRCEVCDGHVRVSGAAAGRRVFCPHCKYATTVPSGLSNPRVVTVEPRAGQPA